MILTARQANVRVLNLIITGIPSIPKGPSDYDWYCYLSFKPYYNWNTFNTKELAYTKFVKEEF